MATATVQIGRARVWRVALGTRIMFVFVAAFMYGMAALIAAIPTIVATNDHSADWIIFLTAVVMFAFALFMTDAVVACLRIRASVDANRLTARVVDGHNLFLVPHFRVIDVPLAEIASVEMRQEIVRSFGFTSTRSGLSIVTKAGERIGLLSDTFGTATTLPIDDLAQGIADAAGIKVKDDGTVRTRNSGLYGAESSSWTEAPLPDSEAQKARRTAIRTASIVSTSLLLVYLVRALVAFAH